MSAASAKKTPADAAKPVKKRVCKKTSTEKKAETNANADATPVKKRTCKKTTSKKAEITANADATPVKKRTCKKTTTEKVETNANVVDAAQPVEKRTCKKTTPAKKTAVATPENAAPSTLSPTERRQLADRVFATLTERYPNPSCALDHRSPFQLLVATILSAQCTDKRVNAVTPALFERFPTAEAFADAPVEAIEELIKSCGFYRAKAANIAQASRAIVERFNGEVPATLEELVRLPGVGRKTANVVLGNAFGIASGFVVDTHVLRLSRKIGLSDEETPEKVERDLNELVPQSDWVDGSHRLIYLGREYCIARRPQCDACPLGALCLKRP
ncbi:MAG: endonuclease III [Thermoguttaceae bacterium]|nr:endonuclease III [Thermoguttaceae bacterium]